jgi:pSer/pThr/pTyr-binding forkhead associated (FHA) protein
VRVGRTSKSDFVLPTDTHLSGMRFEVALEENECRLRDLKSTNGTMLNGQRTNEAALRDGDTIVAGETTLRVRMLIGTARGPDPGPPLPTDTTLQLRLLTLLRTKYQPLYAILDAARDIRIPALLKQSKEE